MPRIAAELEAYLRSGLPAAGPERAPGLLITDHGVTVWGWDLAQARNRLECVESICRQLVLAAAQGGHR